MSRRSTREHEAASGGGRLVAGFFSAQGLPWLLRLRWLAVLGQATTCLAATAVGFSIPWTVLGAFLLVTVSTNLAVQSLGSRLSRDPDRVCAALLAQDTLVLAGMLWWTGGVDNPFNGFFLLHVVIASVLLPRSWSWWFLGLSAACLGLQFLSPHPLVAARPLPLGIEGASRLGIFVDLVLVGASVAFFVGRLRKSISQKDLELERARVRSERHERFATVATLAAGVAHELATPLSTIAVVSSDFERLAGGHCGNGECISDARLIRSEVERCRKVLESLGQRATDGIGDPAVLVEISEIPDRIRPFLHSGKLERLDFRGFQDAGTIVVPLPPLLQSLAALAKNACEASPPTERVAISVKTDSDGAVFEVADRGEGMDPSTVLRAGEPFFTTKGPGRGMGLGLFLVRTFVERVQGSLEIDSRPGEGSVFRMAIPSRTEPS